MKTTPLKVLAFVLLCLSASTAPASPLSLEAGVAYAHLSGLYSPTWEYKPLSNDKSDFAIPEISLRYRLTDNWAVSVGYAHYSDLRSMGVTGLRALDPSDNPIGIDYPALGKQRLDEFDAKLLYAYELSPRLRVEAGPVLSLLHSRYTYELYGSSQQTSLPFQDWNIERNDLRLGAQAGFRYDLTDRLILSLNYRYVAPVGREAHLVGLSLGCRL